MNSNAIAEALQTWTGIVSNEVGHPVDTQWVEVAAASGTVSEFISIAKSSGLSDEDAARAASALGVTNNFGKLAAALEHAAKKFKDRGAAKLLQLLIYEVEKAEQTLIDLNAAAKEPFMRESDGANENVAKRHRAVSEAIAATEGVGDFINPRAA